MRSDHPVSTAVVAHWKALQAADRLMEVTDFEALTGRGVKGTINGETFFLGNHRLAHELGIWAPNWKLSSRLSSETARRPSCSALRRAAAYSRGCRYDPRNQFDAIKRMPQMGIEAVMLTGDNPHTARGHRQSRHLTDARGNLLPEDKLAAIDDLIASMATSAWWATASTMRPRWRKPTSASPWARQAPTPRWKQPMSR